MEWTPFSGQTALDENDPITIDGASFLIKNPRISDRLLHVGAVTHRHDAHAALPNPQTALTGSVESTGGSIGGGQDFAVAYAIIDTIDGGETTASPPLLLSTGPTLSDPTIAPSASADYTQGIMPDGTFYYALTYTDGAGGETVIGPTTVVAIDPGYASAAVSLTGLAAQLGGSAVAWRLWRSYEGEDWHLVTQGSTDDFLDGGFDPPDNPARPPDATTAAGTNRLLVTLPDAIAEPALASASKINIYLAPDVSFTEPCFYTQLPPTASGSTLVITDDIVSQGSPPHVSTSIPGASKIWSDTELIFGLKSPVATYGELPAGTRGDVRVVLDTKEIFGVLGASADGASGWTALGGGSESWKSPVPSASGLSPFGNTPGDALIALDTSEAWVFASGSAEVDFIDLPRTVIEHESVSPITAGSLATDGTYIYYCLVTTSVGDVTYDGTLHVNASGAIGRAKLDGSDVNHAFITGLSAPAGLAVDDGHIYWTEGGSGIGGSWVSRANIDGSGVEQGWILPAAGGSWGFSTAGQVVVTASHVYFTVYGTPVPPPGGMGEGAIMRVDLDGSNLTEIVQLGADEPGSLAIDDSHLYWSAIMSPPGAIARAALDGSDIERTWAIADSSSNSPADGNLTVGDGWLYYARSGSTFLDTPVGTISRIRVADGTLESSWLTVDTLGVHEGAPSNARFLTLRGNELFYTRWGDTTGPPAISRYSPGEWVPLTGGAGSWKDPVASGAALPLTGNGDGDVRVTLDTDAINVWSASGSTWIGLTGGGGPQGPTGPAGELFWAGDWNLGSTYATNAVVHGPDGSGYVSLQDANTNHSPASSPTWWALLVERGADGGGGGGGGGGSNFKGTVATTGALPAVGNTDGDVWVVLADHSLRIWNDGTSNWNSIASTDPTLIT